MFVVEDEVGIATIIYYQQTVKQIEFIQEAALPKTSKVSISIINKKTFSRKGSYTNKNGFIQYSNAFITVFLFPPNKNLIAQNFSHANEFKVNIKVDIR